jgi:hypothetical protein
MKTNKETFTFKIGTFSWALARMSQSFYTEGTIELEYMRRKSWKKNKLLSFFTNELAPYIKSGDTWNKVPLDKFEENIDKTATDWEIITVK